MLTKKIEEVHSIILNGQAIQERLAQETKRVSLRQKIPGFRPGKVPLDIVFDMNEERVVSSVLDGLLKEKIRELDTQNVIRTFVNVSEKVHIKFGDPCDVPVEVTVVYEPEVPEITWSDNTLPVLSTEIDDKELKEITTNYLTQMKRSQPLESPRPSQLGDVLTLRVHIQDGEEERVSTMRLPLVEGELPADVGIEDLVGIDVGHVVTQRIKIPRFMSHVPLAGKKVSFSLSVEDIQRLVPCDYDEESAQYVAQCDLATLSERIKHFIQRNIQNLTRTLQKECVEAHILSLTGVDISSHLVQERIQELRHKYDKLAEFNALVPQEDREAWYESIARAQLTRDFFIKQYAERHQEETRYDASDIFKMLEIYAKARRITSQQAVQKYMKDAEFNTWIQEWVQSQKVLEHIMTLCKQAEVPVMTAPSAWNDVEPALKIYQELVGGRTKDFDLLEYIRTLSLKHVDFSESHTAEASQVVLSDVDVSDEVPADTSSEA